MTVANLLPPPAVVPPLDPYFRPPALFHRDFQAEAETRGERVTLGLEGEGGRFSRYEMRIFPKGHRRAPENLFAVERVVKFLLWQRGGFRLYVGGPPRIGEAIRRMYAADGARAFERAFLATHVYERPFEVQVCRPDEVPPPNEQGRNVGGHLDGCRIGFDLGASDRKVAAVINGEVVYSEEVVWEPRKHADPHYHYREILAALQAAAAHMPRVDAIGGSAAGIYINNQPRVASLFRAVPPERFGEVKSLFHRLQRAMGGVPLVVINDGDITALAGALNLRAPGILGIAMGSSEAVGFVDAQGKITGWLNELSFAPVDYSPHAPLEEWSGGRGCGATYLSQQAVFRLASQAGIEVPADVPNAEKLKSVQAKLEADHAGAVQIWETMGVYLGYTIAHYASFYDLRHVLVLGRCTSGRGGNLLLENARKVLQREFPPLAEMVQLHLPDEKSRRVGQAVAAASLPSLA